MTGPLRRPLARIKVDEKKWQSHVAVSPAHGSGSVEHRNQSQVEQEGLSPMPKDCGAEQGDVDGSLERRLALGIVAAETRGSIAARQVAGTLPWIGVAIASRPRKPSARNSQLPAWRPGEAYRGLLTCNTRCRN